MTDETPIVQAYKRLVNKAIEEFEDAAQNNSKAALKHEADAEVWFAASEAVFDTAIDADGAVEQALAMQSFFLSSGIEAAQNKLTHTRIHGEQEE